MSKRIVFCADGTWDTAAKNSNVHKIHLAMTDDADQYSFYDDGVGADGNILERLLGGASGLGLWQKIKAGYQSLAEVYAPGDEISLFGFSRGAFTARALAGMIAHCGMPTQGNRDAVVDIAFDVYRRKRGEGDLAPFAMFNTKIAMVGVWDTVGSLGIPGLFGGIDPLIDGFLDTKLNPNVLKAYHAVGIDEHRTEFMPTLWTSQPQPGQVLEQVWFCGAHSDVGGADSDQVDGKPALADITLAWMIGKATAAGLQFRPEAVEQYQLPLAAEYSTAALDNSWKPLWGVPTLRPIPDSAVLASSVGARCGYDARYRPDNVMLAPDGMPSRQYDTFTVVAPAEVTRAAGAGN